MRTASEVTYASRSESVVSDISNHVFTTMTVLDQDEDLATNTWLLVSTLGTGCSCRSVSAVAEQATLDSATSTQNSNVLHSDGQHVVNLAYTQFQAWFLVHLANQALQCYSCAVYIAPAVVCFYPAIGVESLCCCKHDVWWCFPGWSNVGVWWKF